MASETLSPDSIAASSCLSFPTSPEVATLQDDPDSPSSPMQWATQTCGEGSDTYVRATFPTPSGNLNTGAGLQEFRVRWRTADLYGSPDALDIDLYEDGVFVANLYNEVNPSNGGSPLYAGEVISATWDASLLSDISGADVEIRVYTTADASPPGQTCTGEVSGIEWNVDYNAGIQVNLTGVESQGQASPVTVEVSGGISVTLAGAESQGQAGSLTLKGSAIQFLSGNETQGHAGIIAANAGAKINIAGLQSEGQAGVITVNTTAGTQITLSGVSSVGGVGTLSATGGAVIPLDSSQTTGQAGTFLTRAGATIAIDGLETQGQIGNLAIQTESGISIQISGVQSQGQIGDLTTLGHAINQISGVEVSGLVGVFDITGNAKITLEGVIALGEIGEIYAKPGYELQLPGLHILTIEKDDRILLIVAEENLKAIEADQTILKIKKDNRVILIEEDPNKLIH